MQFKKRSILESRKIPVKLEAEMWRRLEQARSTLENLDLHDDLDARIEELLERWVSAVEKLDTSAS